MRLCMWPVSYTHLDVYKRQAYIIKKWTDENSSQTECYKLAAFSGQLYNLYIYWSENHYQESPQELADIVGAIYGS